MRLCKRESNKYFKFVGVIIYSHNIECNFEFNFLSETFTDHNNILFDLFLHFWLYYKNLVYIVIAYNVYIMYT